MKYSNAETIKVGSGIRGIHLVLATVALVAVFWGSSWVSNKDRMSSFVENLGFLKVQMIDVTTEWPLDNSQAKGWVAPLQNRNIFTIDSEQVATSLKSHAWVESVAIKKGYPNRIQVSLTARKPHALVIHKGQPWFLDPKGELIERATPQLLKGLELPFLSFEKSQQWNVEQVLSQYDKMKQLADKKFYVSQIVLGKFPYFKTYLSQPKIEVWWSFENWESQIKNLISLIDNPPSQVGQLRRINLVFPKKAIVSSTISH